MILGTTFTLSLFPLPTPRPLIEGEEGEVKREGERDKKRRGNVREIKSERERDKEREREA